MNDDVQDPLFEFLFSLMTEEEKEQELKRLNEEIDKLKSELIDFARKRSNN